MSPAATAFEAPSHLRVGCFAKANGSAPSPVATAVSSASTKTVATPVGSTHLRRVCRADEHRSSGGPQDLGRDATQPQAPGESQSPTANCDKGADLISFPGFL